MVEYDSENSQDNNCFAPQAFILETIPGVNLIFILGLRPPPHEVCSTCTMQLLAQCTESPVLLPRNFIYITNKGQHILDSLVNKIRVFRTMSLWLWILHSSNKINSQILKKEHMHVFNF